MFSPSSTAGNDTYLKSAMVTLGGLRRAGRRPDRRGPPHYVGEECSPSSSNICSTSVGSVAVQKQVKPKHERLMKLKARLAKSGEHLQTVELLYSTSPDGGLDLDRSTRGLYSGPERETAAASETSGSTGGPGRTTTTRTSTRNHLGVKIEERPMGCSLHA